MSRWWLQDNDDTASLHGNLLFTCVHLLNTALLTLSDVKLAMLHQLAGMYVYKGLSARELNVVQALVDARAACEAAVSALGGCINHLRTILLDK